ncbi:hypothetical protein [Streptomyces sp. NPDC046887]|uniref:SCO2583 family membrane protein n=1 Tax=Streptomyces sp. NPDC046887 TaxID=3155472 RepID=UPI00341006D2
MTGRGEPPEGTPEGAPGGGDEEYRSVVFDETFIRAARLQESSAKERLTQHAAAVRTRPLPPGRGAGGRSALLLVLVVAMAFASVLYLGVRTTTPAPGERAAEPLRTTVVALAPQSAVPGGRPAELFARSPAAPYPSGAAGVAVPPSEGTAHFSGNQVTAALAIAKDYLVRSSLDPDVLSGRDTRPVRLLLDPGLHDQFDHSMDNPADDGRHAATGWLVRFDPDETALADAPVRVRGTLRASEAAPGVLEVASDHTFVYAVRPAGAGAARADASLFTVRRELTFRFDRDDLRMHRAELLNARVLAGPQACGTDTAAALHPVPAGRSTPPAPPVATDPYAPGAAATALCGALAPSAQPSVKP